MRTKGSKSATWELTRLFLRTRLVRLSATLPAVGTFAILLILFFSQYSTISPTQYADQQIGSADAIFTAVPDRPLGSNAASADNALAKIVHSRGGTQSHVNLIATDLQGKSVSGKGWIFEQDAWQEEPYPSRLTLLSGTWPSRAGDVCVTEGLADDLPRGTATSLFDGAIPFNVECVVLDRYATNAKSILAAPGTWEQAAERLDQAQAQRWDATASARLLFAGGETLEIYQDLMRDAGLGASLDYVDLTTAPLELRDTVTAEPRSLTPGGNAYAFSVPRLFIPAIFSIVATVLIVRFLRRSRHVLATVGVPTSQLRRTMIQVPLTAVVGGTLIGIVAGLVAGALLRLIMPRFLTHPLGPVEGIPSTIGIILAVGVASTLLAESIRRITPENRKIKQTKVLSTRRRSSVPTLVVLGTLAIIGCLTAGIAAANRMNSQTSMATAVFFFGFALVIALPFIVKGVSGLKSEDSARELAHRKIHANRTAPFVAALVALTVLLSTGFVTALTSQLRTFNDTTESLVPPGQARLMVMDPDAVKLLPTLKRDIEEESGVSGLSYWLLDRGTELGDGPLYTAASIQGLEALLNTTLTQQEQISLKSGAVLRTKDTDSSTLGILNADMEKVELQAPVIVRTDLDPSLSNAGGYMLHSAAEQQGVEKASIKGVFFTGLSDEQTTDMSQFPEQLRFSEAWLSVYSAPDDFEMPASVTIAGVSIAILGFGLMCLYAVALGKELRPHVASLWALGLGRKWLSKTLLWQLTLTIGLGALTGLVAGILGMAAASMFTPIPFTLTVPWAIVVLVLAGILTGTTIGYRTGAIRLIPSDRGR